jgi:hypothetical protein
MKRRYTNGKITYEIGGVYRFNREEIRLLSLAMYNEFAGTAYASVQALCFSPPPWPPELSVRAAAGLEPWDLSPLVVLDEVPEGKLEIFIDAVTWRDVRETLVPL